MFFFLGPLTVNSYESEVRGWGETLGTGAGGRLVAFRVGFDDVINNELSGVFIRNDTNSEVIKLRSLRLPGERWREVTSACGLKSP